MSTREETNDFLPVSKQVESADVSILSPQPEFQAKVETFIDHANPGKVDLPYLDALNEEALWGLSVDIEPDWSGPDGLMTALLGEPPKLSGLELSLDDSLFVAANQETSIYVYPVLYPIAPSRQF
jgi:hypothetical protein